jgi:ABC-type Fe3+-hydroxamate transport system substrate-binding protein
VRVKRHPQAYRTILSRPAALLCAVAVLMALSAAPAAAGCAAPALERQPLVVLGDRIATVCHRLGVAPAAWVGRRSLMDNGDVLAAASEPLGCPNAFCGKRQKAALERIRTLSPAKLLVSPPGCIYRPDLSYEKPLKSLEAEGFAPVFIDFTDGPLPAVRRIATELGRSEQGEILVAAYEKEMARARQRMEAVPRGVRVAVVSGTFQAGTGKSFLRLEAAGGYTDDLILKPMGAVNVAADVLAADAKIGKGHAILRRLDKVLEARPDVIAATGDALAVSAAIAETLARRPELADAPAVRHGAVHALPFHADADPLGYPEVLMRWAAALEKSGGRAD